MNHLEQSAMLENKALDWAAHKALGRKEEPHVEVDNLYGPQWRGPEYSSDWAYGGPVIEEHRITIEWRVEPHAKKVFWLAKCPLRDGNACGRTPLEAAMRALVISYLGSRIEIPDELRPQHKAAA